MKRILMLLVVLVLLQTGLFSDIKHVIGPGDCLYNLALRYYKDPTLWRALKIYNHISDVYKIPDGKVILIPSRKKAEAIMNGGTVPSTTSQPTGSGNSSGNSGGNSSNYSGASGGSNCSSPNYLPPYKLKRAMGCKAEVRKN